MKNGSPNVKDLVRRYSDHSSLPVSFNCSPSLSLQDNALRQLRLRQEEERLSVLKAKKLNETGGSMSLLGRLEEEMIHLEKEKVITEHQGKLQSLVVTESEENNLVVNEKVTAEEVDRNNESKNNASNNNASESNASHNNSSENGVSNKKHFAFIGLGTLLLLWYVLRNRSRFFITNKKQ